MPDYQYSQDEYNSEPCRADSQIISRVDVFSHWCRELPAEYIVALFLESST